MFTSRIRGNIGHFSKLSNSINTSTISVENKGWEKVHFLHSQTSDKKWLSDLHVKQQNCLFHITWLLEVGLSEMDYSTINQTGGKNKFHEHSKKKIVDYGTARSQPIKKELLNSDRILLCIHNLKVEWMV